MYSTSVSGVAATTVTPRAFIRASESVVAPDATGSGKRVLLIDHDDSFVHMLADYFRQVGAEVSVTRHQHAQAMLNEGRYDLLVLSPGPPGENKPLQTFD